uniref:Zinc finger, CCHC-type n=1 Tax=Tanacetum cinerariifolium TaxID=118510 RepID=A0A6L2LAX4_TANCI|nr:zinc finger, CCHC-type [Tanacetum cinerariifolium]
MMRWTNFNIEKFDGKTEFGLWQVRMKALLEQPGLATALEELHAATIMAYDNVIQKKILKVKGDGGEGLYVRGRSGQRDIEKGIIIRNLKLLYRYLVLGVIDGHVVTKKTLKGRKRLGEYQTGWKIKTGFNESEEYKKTSIGSGVGTCSVKVLQGVEFEVEPQKDHTFEWKAELEKDIYARSDVYVLSNGCRKSSDDKKQLLLCKAEIWVTKGLLNEANGNMLGLEIVRYRSRNTLKVSQSRFYNEKLVHTLLEGHSILSLKGGLSGECDVEKNDGFDHGLQTDVQVMWILTMPWEINHKKHTPYPRLDELKDHCMTLKNMSAWTSQGSAFDQFPIRRIHLYPYAIST